MQKILFIGLFSDFECSLAPIKNLGGVDKVVVFLLRAEPPSLDDERDYPSSGYKEETTSENAIYLEPNENDIRTRFYIEDEFQKVTDALGFQPSIIQFSTGDSFEKIFEGVKNVLKANKGKKDEPTSRFFFLTETTLVMASAIITACLIEGVPIFMPNKVTGGLIHLPILKMQYSTVLRKGELKTLKFILSYNKPIKVSMLARELKVKDSTISERLKEMESRGLVSRKRDELKQTEVLVEISPAGKFLIEQEGDEQWN